MGNKTIIVIAPSASQPRYHKRVEQLANFGNIKIFSFRRGLYEENKFNSLYEFYDLGKIKDRKYYGRILKFIYAIFSVKKHIPKNSETVFYAFSLDCALIAKLSGIKLGYLEVGDLILKKGLGLLSKPIESFLFKNLEGVFFTSNAFVGEYTNSDLIQERNAFVINNKLSPFFIDRRPDIKNISETTITIGLIGLLRYKRPIERVLNFVKQNPGKIKLLCYGDGPLKQYIIDNSCESIIYKGSFKNPEDLSEIYSQVDVNYVVYDNIFHNVTLAIPNKLYESAYFGIPIICAESTHLGQVIKDWDIGDTISIENQRLFDDKMSKYIRHSWLRNKSSNCFKIPTISLLDNGKEILKKIFKR